MANLKKINTACSIITVIFFLIGSLNADYKIARPTQKNSDKYVISGWQSGFFSNFLGMLNHLLWADQNNKTPVILWDKNFLYFEDTAPNGNAWEYYFEPVSTLTYQSGDTISNLRFYPSGSYPVYWSPSGYQLPYNTPSMFDQNLRNICFSLISRYIKIKPRITEKVEMFFNNYVQSKKTIGVHLRGTDKHTEVGRVNIDLIFKQANNISDSFGKDCQFFIATDEQRLLDLAKEKLNRKIIYCDTVKSESLQNQSHVNALSNPATSNLKNRLMLGEEVLIDALILSKCDAFIHTLSLVSQCVSYFNPNLPCYLVNAKHKLGFVEQHGSFYEEDYFEKFS